MKDTRQDIINATLNPPVALSEETKLQMIKRSIQSLEGWVSLAQVISSGDDPIRIAGRRDDVLGMFAKIAGDKNVTIPVTNVVTNGQPTNETSMEVPFVEVLTQQLDSYLEKLK